MLWLEMPKISGGVSNFVEIRNNTLELFTEQYLN